MGGTLGVFGQGRDSRSSSPHFLQPEGRSGKATGSSASAAAGSAGGGQANNQSSARPAAPPS